MTVNEPSSFDGLEINEEDRDAPLVRSIRVTELFGRYTYHIGVRGSAAPPVILLYGDNGSGKTTVLNLLWHLLSPAPNRGHRTALAKTSFREFQVVLSNGDNIIARKTGTSLLGDYEVVVSRGRKTLLTQLYPVNAEGAVTGHRTNTILVRELVKFNDVDYPVEVEQELAESSTGEDLYVAYLAKINVDPYFLADNRRIYSDHFTQGDLHPFTEYEYEQRARRAGAAVRARSGLASELVDALQQTGNWLRQQVLSGTAQGSQGADAIYLDVLSGLVGTASSQVVSEAASLSEVIKRLSELDARSKQFSEFGLVPYVQAEPFIALINEAVPSRASIIEGVLTPYLDGQRARLDSLQETESLIRTFVETVNSFLVNKRITYSLRYGLRIRTTDDGSTLSPEQLSSGERQLLLLLCHAMLSRAESALFIIDEPEISLNVKWQRKLISALLSCVRSSNVQFILATHSVEIITGHRQYLARLRNQQKAINA